MKTLRPLTPLPAWFSIFSLSLAAPNPVVITPIVTAPIVFVTPAPIVSTVYLLLPTSITQLVVMKTTTPGAKATALSTVSSAAPLRTIPSIIRLCKGRKYTDCENIAVKDGECIIVSLPISINCFIFLTNGMRLDDTQKQYFLGWEFLSCLLD